MKKLMMIISTSLFCFSGVFASPEDISKNIQALKALNIEEISWSAQQASEQDLKKQDEIFIVLEKSVKQAVTEASDELEREILKVAVVMLKKDNTQFAGQVLLPLYKKNEEAFLSSLKQLKDSDATLVKEAVQNAERELTSGNG